MRYLLNYFVIGLAILVAKEIYGFESAVMFAFFIIIAMLLLQESK